MVRNFNVMLTYLKSAVTYIVNVSLIPRALKLRGSALFSAQFYVDTYQDIDSAYLLPELHFLRHGMYEMRNPHPLFDTKHYIEQIPHFFSLKTDPISHFLAVGAAAYIDPHPLFNVRYYCQTIDIGPSINPLVHYLSGDSNASGDPNPLFFHADYERNATMEDTDEPSLLAYVNQGDTAIQTFSPERLEECNRHMNFTCYIERFSTYCSVLFVTGWAFAPGKTISRVGYYSRQGSIVWFQWPGLPSADLVEEHGVSAENSRFNLRLFKDLPENHLELVLVYQFTDGSAAYDFKLDRYGLQERPHTYFLDDIVFNMLQNDPSEAHLLEIGSRARSGFVLRGHLIPEWFHYTGIDIMEGDNVDIVCDAHDLSTIFQPEQFDYVIALNVFEHLLIPWKVIVELNRVLKTGGKVIIFTHQTMPLHDTPCDYWRLSDNAWKSLFCKATGFALEHVGMGDPVDIVAQKVHGGSYTLSLDPAFIHSMVIAEKISASVVSWDVDVEAISDQYPDTLG